MSKAFSNFYSKIIPAGDSLQMNVTGSVLQCRKCSQPSPLVTVAFDNGQDNPISNGDIFDLKNSDEGPQRFTNLLFRNASDMDATITFRVGNFAVTFGKDNAVDSTYARGNFGCASSQDVSNLIGSYVTSVSISHPGTGRHVGDILTVQGGTGRACTLKVTAVNPSTGRTLSVSIVDAGSYTVQPSNPVSVSGGHGGGGDLFNLTFSSNISGISYNSTYKAVDVDANSTFITPNTDGGRTRKQIVFRIVAGSHGLVLQDLNGRLLIKISPTDPPVTFETDAQFILKGDGGTATISIAELYYAAL